MKLRAFLFLLAALAFAGTARGQAYYFSQPVINARGLPTPGANAAICSALATTAASVANNIATLTMASNPITAGFTAGGTIVVSQFTSTDIYLNGSYQVAAVSSTTLSYGLTHANASASTNGTVVEQGTSSTACAPLVTLYTDSTAAFTSPNPFTADGLGNLSFWATPAQVYSFVYGPAVDPTLAPVTIPCVLNSGCGGGSPGSPNLSVQYNNSGVFGGSAFLYSGSSCADGSSSPWCIYSDDSNTGSSVYIGPDQLTVTYNSLGPMYNSQTNINGGEIALSDSFGNFVSLFQPGGITLGRNGTPEGGTIILNGLTSGYAQIQVNAVAGTPSPLVLPTATGINGEALCTDGNTGAQNLYWCSGGGGAPGGSDTQIQYNDMGAFAGGGNFTWNYGTNTLTITGTESISGQLTSTLATGTAPFVVASTTVVANLNASLLGGATFGAPGTIGGVTAGAAFFTSDTATSFVLTEGTPPSAVSGKDIFYGDSTAHVAYLSNDGGGFAQIRTGTVGVAVGGTSLTNIPTGDLLCGNGTGTPTLIPPVSSGYVLTDNGAGVCGTYQVGPTGMSSSLDTVTAAMADATIGNGAYQERWNSAQAGNKTAFYLGESGAATSTGNIKLRVSTLSTSTAEPFRFDNNGNGIIMTDVGIVEALGTGYVDYTGALGNFPAACTNQFVTTLATAGCTSVSLTAAVTGVLPVANGGTNTSNAPVKRILIRFAGCNAGTASPSFDLPTSGAMGYNCKTDGSNGTVQGVLSASASSVAYATLNLPDDWASFNTAKLSFTTADATNGHTIIFDVQTACTTPNGGNVDTPTYNGVNAFTTVTIGGGATPNALYSTTTTGSLTGTGCAAGRVLHLKLSRSGSDTSTDTAIALTGDLIVAYNGTYQ